MPRAILGPCSFEDCEEFAFSRCFWKNQFKLSSGGCDELFCDDHAYIPKGSKNPVCCAACEAAFNSDKRRTRYVIGIGALIICLVLLVLIIIAVLMGEQEKKGNQIPLNQQNLEPVEPINPWIGVDDRIVPLFNESMDQHVQS